MLKVLYYSFNLVWYTMFITIFRVCTLVSPPAPTNSSKWLLSPLRKKFEVRQFILKKMKNTYIISCKCISKNLPRQTSPTNNQTIYNQQWEDRQKCTKTKKLLWHSRTAPKWANYIRPMFNDHKFKEKPFKSLPSFVYKSKIYAFEALFNNKYL